MSKSTIAEYIWLDGSKPQELRSKSRILPNTENPSLENFPKWSFDGSSTSQSPGSNSDLLLIPVSFRKDPTRKGNHFLVLCSVHNADGSPHSTNPRAILEKVMAHGGEAFDAWFGFEQEYTLFAGRCPLGWPENGYPKPQGPFYCGTGADKVFGRNLIEEHMQACIEADLMIYGCNAEVMPGQWEFQIGYRPDFADEANTFTFCDDLLFARWLLCRIAEDYDITVSFENKPVAGDWNGAGCHTNFSTKEMRNPRTGLKTFQEAIERLEKNHDKHITVYGENLAKRLTGLHETCAIDQFRSGVADRGSSIRIPQQVKLKGYGYLEDRRPGANCNPYLVAARMIVTVCNLDESLLDNLYKTKSNGTSRPSVEAAVLTV